MGNRSRSYTRVVALVALLVTLLPATPAVASHSRLAELRRQERATRARLSGALIKDKEVRAVLNRVASRLRSERSDLAVVRSALSRIELRMRAEERRLKALDARQGQRRRVINARIAEMYVQGPVSSQEVAASGTSLADVVERAGSLEFLMNFDRVVLEDLARIEDQSKKTRAALGAQRKEANAVRKTVQERVDSVSELVATQQAAHNRLSGSISAARSQIAALEREQNRINAIIRSRGSTGSVGTGGASSRGYRWPVRGRITSPYGPRWGSFHTGMDIDCRTGDPIGASKSGRVIASEWGGGYGQMVIIDHGGGYSTLYAHMSRLYVGRGAKVSAAQKIGACGSTGNSTGDHLHFEVRVNGNHRNPRPFLP